MPVNLTLLGGVLIALAALISYVFGIRALQNSRRLANFQRRRRYIIEARRSFILSVLLLGIMSFVLFGGRVQLPQSLPWPFQSRSQTPTLSATRPVNTSTPTFTKTAAFSASPTLGTPGTGTLTPTPSIPIPIQAQFLSQVTPQPGSEIGSLRFATQLRGNQLVGPAVRFNNPIHQMVAVFSYAGMTSGVQWTALWYRDGEFVDFETKVWGASGAGAGIIELILPVDQWFPGMYEVQIFIGSEWKASGSFILSGTPASMTPTSTITPSPTASFTPTQTPSPTSTRTRIPTLTPTVTRTRAPTNTPTPTRTRRPTSTTIPLQ